MTVTTMDSKETVPKINYFAESTTLHGFKNIFDNKHNLFRRVLWTALLLCMLSMYLYLISNSLLKYYRYESSTSIKKVKTNELQFPAVSICDQNVVPKSLLDEHPALKDTLLKRHTGKQNNLTTPELKEARQIMEGISLYDVFMYSMKHFDKHYFGCSYDAKPFACRDFVTPVMSETSMCYTFQSDYIINRKGVFNVTQPGYFTGLQMTIHLNKENYFLTATEGIGLKILVHEPHVYPRILQGVVSVSPGSEVFIDIEKVTQKSLGKPYSAINCQHNRENTHQHSHNSQYSYEACRLDCLYEGVFTACNCSFESGTLRRSMTGSSAENESVNNQTSPLNDDINGTSTHYNKSEPAQSSQNNNSCEGDSAKHNNFTGPLNSSNDDDNERQCSLYDFYNCMYDKIKKYYSKDCGCLQPCEHTVYKTVVSSLEFPSPMVVETARLENWTWKTADELKKNVVKLYVYFNALEYTEIEQMPVYTRDAMVADFGGFLGLFLGASLLTMVEMVEFVVVVVYGKCKTCFCRKKGVFSKNKVNQFK